MLWSPFAGTLSLEYFDFQTAFFFFFNHLPESPREIQILHIVPRKRFFLYGTLTLNCFFYGFYTHKMSIVPPTCFSFFLHLSVSIIFFHSLWFWYNALVLLFWISSVRVYGASEKRNTRTPCTLILGNNTIIIKWLIDFNNNKQSSNWAQRLIGNVQSNEADAHCTLHTNQIIW